MRVPRFERGPEGRRHWPAWRKGCWYGRPSESCHLCRIRLLAVPVPYVFRAMTAAAYVLLVTAFVAVGIHESAAVGWEYLTTGTAPACPSGFPFRFHWGFLDGCVGDVSSPGQALSGPVAAGLFGLGLLYYSSRMRASPERVGLVVGGVLTWLFATLSALGLFRDVAVVAESAAVIARSGYWAQLPGLSLLVAGLVLLVRLERTRERPG